MKWASPHRKMAESGVFSTMKLLGKPLLVVALLCLGGAPDQASAQERGARYEQNAQSTAARAGLSRAGGGKVLSVERLQTGRDGMTRVKIRDDRGVVQVYVIQDGARIRNDSPFEAEESGRMGRFFRGEPNERVREVITPRPRSPRMRSGDVRDQD